MNEADVEFDGRQLTQLKVLNQRMLKREIKISQFVHDQWSLLEMLRTVQPEWVSSYRALVNEIDDIVSAAYGNNQSQLSDIASEKVDSNLVSMDRLIGSLRLIAS